MALINNHTWVKNKCCQTNLIFFYSSDKLHISKRRSIRCNTSRLKIYFELLSEKVGNVAQIAFLLSMLELAEV